LREISENVTVDTHKMDVLLHGVAVAMCKMQTIILRTKWSIVIILKIVKSLYLHNAFTDLDEICIGVKFKVSVWT